MRRRNRGRTALRAIVIACALAISASTVCAQVQVSYLYTLSNFSGRLPYNWVRVSVDLQRDEIYVLYQDLIRIFGPTGMEIFSFGDDLELGHILDAAVDENGDIILLSYKDSRAIVTRCNFRGVPASPFEITNLPEGVEFHANRIVHRNGLFYFVSLASSSVIVTDSSGEFRKRVDFLALIDPEERPKGDAETIGFTVDHEGNIFFTIPTIFKVFKLSTDGVLTSFGRPGSAAGRFGVIAGIAIDSRGHLLVADKLKCVVMIFDKDFNFLAEFGYRGPRPENLIIPDDIAVDARDRVYVSQGRQRGVSVFALAHQ